MPDRFSASSVTTRIRVATVGSVILLFVLAALFYGTVQRYQYLLTRSELAHDVLLNYLTVSDHAYRKLNAMGEIVTQGRVEDHQARYANVASLRDALGMVRQSIAAEVAFVGDLSESDELDHLVEIERLAEQIIAASTRIRRDVEFGRLDEARRDLTNLRGEAIADRFSELINIALEDERREVAATEQAAQRLGNQLTWALPIAVLVIFAFGVLVTALISGSITRSVEVLRRTALAYASGDFDYRTDQLYERQFAELGDAFDRMGEELSRRRDAVIKQTQDLEALVGERTQGLRETNEQLARADRARRRLLADISHELRTPLTVIHGEAEMALRGDAKERDEYVEALERIREQALHTNRLVDDLLFVARAEEGHARIDKRAVAVVGVLKAVCADFTAAAEHKRISLESKFADDYIVVYGDSDRLRQVFAILIDNAIRYTDAGGNVRVELALADSGVEIEVRDDGIGLSEEDAEQVFYRFYRGSNAQRAAKGTGLGLPVAKAIVEAHEGHISLTGIPGGGATATVWLPAEDSIRAIA